MRTVTMPVILKLVLIAVALLAAVYDLRIRRIPNWLNLSGLILGFGLNTFFESLPGAERATGGLLVALSIYIPLYTLRGMGAGDVKLMAALGAIAGPGNWLYIFMATALLGGVISVVVVLLRKRTARTVQNISAIVAQLAKGKSPAAENAELSIHGERSLKMPHGAVIAAGVSLFLAVNWNA